MLKAWQRLLGPLCLSPLELKLRAISVLPAITLRRVEEQDVAVCVKLYEINAPGRFPAGVGDNYPHYLRRPDCLFWVAELGGQIVGTCGVKYYNERTDMAWLSCGLVAPDYQQQGVGAAMLLARLALLGKESTRGVWVRMGAVDASVTFYEKFGFRVILDEATPNGVHIKTMQLWVTLSEMRLVRTVLEKHRIAIPWNDHVPMYVTPEPEASPEPS